MGFGKWIVGALGWAMLGPIGGILGYYLTSRLEKLSEASYGYGEDVQKAAEEKFKAVSQSNEMLSILSCSVPEGT